MGILKQIQNDEKLNEKFFPLVKRIAPNFTSWLIDSSNGYDYLKYSTPITTHKANTLGEGFLSIIRVCIQLSQSPEGQATIIDEPELSLHPSTQKAMSQVISESSKKKQIILCTHSPYFINWSDFANGAQFIRLNKINDEKCTISKLENESKYSSILKTSAEQWQKPQVLDIVAKEILFAEKILFVEGQEDVGLIRKWINENSININYDIFGYGVGGYSKMDLFLEMAKDLGLVKVAALYDSGPDSDQKFDENKVNFSNYYFVKLPTQDIRDKFSSCKKCNNKEKIKEGCFDEHGKLKPERKDEFETIMNNIKEYFQ